MQFQQTKTICNFIAVGSTSYDSKIISSGASEVSASLAERAAASGALVLVSPCPTTAIMRPNFSASSSAVKQIMQHNLYHCRRIFAIVLCALTFSYNIFETLIHLQKITHICILGYLNKKLSLYPLKNSAATILFGCVKISYFKIPTRI